MSAPAADLADLYRQIVLDHSRHPRNQRRPERPGREAEGHNPLCGDKVRVYARLADGRVEDVAWEASGCAICLASASLMSEAARGRGLPAVLGLAADFESALAGTGGSLPGDLAALAGVGRYPSRIRCATLPWRTLVAALESTPGTVTTEGKHADR
jgi:nitrogen fixation NifU-like protein